MSERTWLTLRLSAALGLDIPGSTRVVGQERSFLWTELPPLAAALSPLQGSLKGNAVCVSLFPKYPAGASNVQSIITRWANEENF